MGTRQRSAHVRHVHQLASALDALGIRRGRPVVALVGGAAGMNDGDAARADGVLREAVLPLLDRLGAAVVDGGTDAGIMRATGRAHDALGCRFPLVGVVPAGAMAADGIALEPHHTHAILVPGSAWGVESSWIRAVAGMLAGDQPSVTLVLNGGRITYDDIGNSLFVGRPVVVVAGTGRTADAVAVAASGSWAGELADSMAANPLTTVVHRTDPAAVTAALESALSTAT
jgi:hypothetical protein